MDVSTVELSRARELVGDVLDEIGIDAYLFDIEPGEPDWQVRVECAVEGGWTRHTTVVAKERLLEASEDADARRALREEWERALGACLRRD
ncbi:MAG TPA: hypothetical protein VKA64_09350 [Gammaproteobacteria bacterium]|nr:hypothetical protein [Gammaproteobacteria bacterium]